MTLCVVNARLRSCTSASERGRVKSMLPISAPSVGATGVTVIAMLLRVPLVSLHYADKVRATERGLPFAHLRLEESLHLLRGHELIGLPELLHIFKMARMHHHLVEHGLKLADDIGVGL